MGNLRSTSGSLRAQSSPHEWPRGQLELHAVSQILTLAGLL